MEAWSIIEDAYVDAQFGGHQWEDELSNALVATYSAENGEGAYRQISAMLAKLGDPFTRIVPASCVHAHHKKLGLLQKSCLHEHKVKDLL